jgi:hypothetical protein
MLALSATPNTGTKPRLMPELVTLRTFPDVINAFIGFGTSVIKKKFCFHGA